MKLPGNLGELLQQAAKLQQNFGQVQADLEKKTVEGSAGAGMVTVKISGGLQITSLEIDPALASSGDQQMLQDMVAAACNDALRKAKEMLKSEFSKLAGGFSIPGMG